MNRISPWAVGAIILMILVGNVIFGVASSANDNAGGDGRTLRWDRFDVAIDNIRTAENRFDVVEAYQLSILTGPFRFGTAMIPMDRLNAIENVAVYDNNTRLEPTCSGQVGTVCARQQGGDYSIKYYFRDSARSGTQRSIRIEYTVQGALRSYSGGDQLYWVAVPGDRPFPVLASRVTVTLPPDRPPEVTASYPDTWAEEIAGNTITWTAPGTLDPGDEAEVRVQYPHDPAMDKPSWQSAFDRQREYEENWQPFVSVLLVALGLLIAVGGGLYVFAHYLRYGRDPAAVVTPEYLSAPPLDDPPGVVGALVDEKVDMKDIMATLVDLARRGYFVIEQSSSGGVFGMFASTEFEFHRTEKDASDLRGFERTLLNGIFRGGDQDVKLSELKNKFYKKIPAIKEQLYQELTERGYFTRSPETTRNLWIFGGLGGLVLASALFWLGQKSLTDISPMIIAPPIGLGFASAVAAVFANYMPAKTTKGSQAAAKWRAFRHYMRNVQQYTDRQQVDEQFNQYVGYAVAFGMEQQWVTQCTPALTAMPTWYYPTYVGGPWHGGYHRGRPMSTGRGQAMPTGAGMGDFNLGGPGGLNEMSQSLTEGLNAMSSGLTNMLNDASNVMTSKPSSSGSSGGGFSGGGFSGGGGSGGGSRGFG
jgi:uncharacterized membrane protein YgcG